ncbi:hypothetical protein COEREDRAFT_87781 [Coemansia reversa NRRL 1564]|uniref:MRN complex-interacting protein N-terminal domain-containing protein n=1 Tax=Coemansia reversa (strain ATCC 12441 / NRRL 1564) TaxID=763665 RepID=A0A2G5B9A3_COERN|nr:hypothetical protein COEREDRAFT_87781 [Coemansia reversa NRRL 1564]|eukprot:PIA15596.1 hypothetical protein COEREDRAFT_87781 [Coemansia reversa NRRL 1564]
MPNYQVVRCAGDGCAKFQSQQEKKTNKWSCVVCGLKQSLKRVYFQSTKPKECRTAVMDLNMSRGHAELTKEQHIDVASLESMTNIHTTLKRPEVAPNHDRSGIAVGSKWAEFSEETSDDDTHVNETDYRLDKHNRLVVEASNNSMPIECRPAKRPRHRARPAIHAPQKRVSNVANTHTENSMSHKPSVSTASRAGSVDALSQALASVRHQNRHVGSTKDAGVSSLPCTANTAANNSKSSIDISKQLGSSRWDSYASDSDSGSDE